MKLVPFILCIILLFSLSESFRLKSKSKTNRKTGLSSSRSKSTADPKAAAPAAPATSTAAKKESSGAGPADVNAQKAAVTGIETAETTIPVKACTQSVGVDGKKIADLYNYAVQEPAHLQMTIWNVNIFKSKDPSSLLDSVEWADVDYPVKNITGAPNCLLFSSEKTNKKFSFCLAKEDDLDAWYDAMFVFKMCREGITPDKAKKSCNNVEGASMNVTDPLTGRTMSVADQRAGASLGGGAGKGGCVNCGA